MTLQWHEIEGGQRSFADTTNHGTYWVYWDRENWKLEKITRADTGSTPYCLGWYNDMGDAKRRAQGLAFLDD